MPADSLPADGVRPVGGRRCGVLGSPIGHSLSPVLHRAAYDALGLDWTYDAHEVTTAGLPGFLAGLDGTWRGLSLTMPLKQAALALCTRVSDQARQVDAVNTILVETSGDLVGLNTDIPGFVAAWRDAGIAPDGSAIVLGGGATARSAVAALASIGVRRVTVLMRSPERGGSLLRLAGSLDLTAEVGRLTELPSLSAAGGLLVSTIPAAAQTGVVDDLGAELAGVCDVVYAPRDTPLTRAARRAGLPCAEGYDLLVHQAALQVELMTGLAPAPLPRMRAAGLVELARRG